MFRGLFIGVDRYASPGINWLSCARRDAMALHGLFSDSIGGEAALLTDAEATWAICQPDFDRFDLLLVMDRSNFAELKARAPHEARAKIRPFLDFAPHVGTRDVPDPFFGGAEGFDRALDLIEAAARGLLASLAGEELGAAKRGA